MASKQAKQRMAKAVKEAVTLAKTWNEAPEKVFVKYGLAKSAKDVTRKGGKGCGCGCAFTVEFEYET